MEFQLGGSYLDVSAWLYYLSRDITSRTRGNPLITSQCPELPNLISTNIEFLLSIILIDAATENLPNSQLLMGKLQFVTMPVVQRARRPHPRPRGGELDADF